MNLSSFSEERFVSELVTGLEPAVFIFFLTREVPSPLGHTSIIFEPIKGLEPLSSRIPTVRSTLELYRHLYVKAYKMLFFLNIICFNI